MCLLLQLLDIPGVAVIAIYRNGGSEIAAVVARAISIGLCHPNEKTVACVVATVMNGIESQDTKCFQAFFHQRWLRLDSGTCSRLRPVMLRKVRAQTVAEPTVSM